MKNSVEWKDEFYLSPNRNILTYEQLQIPGLQVFGKHTVTNAISPLVWHYHKDAFEIHYISKGEIPFSTDQKVYNVHGNQTFITRPNEIHSTNYSPISTGEFFWIQLNISDLDNILFLNRESASNLVEGLHNLSSHCLVTNAPQIRPLINRAFHLCMNGGNKYLVAAFLAFFLQHLQNCNPIPHQPTLTPDINQSVKYILAHIYEDISLDVLAEQCFLSTSQYKQKFKKQLGTSPRSYINLQKIEAAKKMLREGHDMTTVAMELGFNTSSYFSTVFKRYNACSPREYIKKHENDKAAD